MDESLAWMEEGTGKMQIDEHDADEDGAGMHGDGAGMTADRVSAGHRGGLVAETDKGS